MGSDQDGVPNDCDSECTQKGMTADYDDDNDNDGIPDTNDIAPTGPLKPASLDWGMVTGVRQNGAKADVWIKSSANRCLPNNSGIWRKSAVGRN